MRSFIPDFCVMPQARSFVTNQAHGVSYETKAFTKVTFSESAIASFVNVAAKPDRCDSQTCLILNVEDFVKDILFQLIWRTHHRHPRHIGKVAVAIASRIQRQRFSVTPPPIGRSAGKFGSASNQGI